MIKRAKIILSQNDILTVRGELKIVCRKDAKYTYLERPEG